MITIEILDNLDGNTFAGYIPSRFICSFIPFHFVDESNKTKNDQTIPTLVITPYLVPSHLSFLWIDSQLAHLEYPDVCSFVCFFFVVFGCDLNAPSSVRFQIIHPEKFAQMKKQKTLVDLLNRDFKLNDVLAGFLVGFLLLSFLSRRNHV
jgi:hypothetical protein